MEQAGAVKAPPREGLLAALAVGALTVALCLLAPLRPQGGDTLPGRLGAVTLACRQSLDLREVEWLRARVAQPPMPYYVHWAPDGALRSTFGPAPALLGMPAMVSLTPTMIVGDRALVRRARYASSGALGVSATLLCVALLAATAWRRAALLALVAACSFAGAATLGQGLWQQTAALPFLLGALASVAWSQDRKVLTPLAATLATLAVWCRPPLLPLAGGLCLAAAMPRRREPRGWAWVSGAIALGLATAALLGWWKLRWTGEALPLGQAAANLRSLGGDVWGLHPWRSPGALLGLLVSPGRGLLVYAPVAILAMVLAARSRDERARCVLVGILGQVLLTVGFRLWWGGATFGPRLLAELVWVAPWLLALAPESPGIRRLEGLTLAVTVAVGLLGLWRFDPRSWELQAPSSAYPARLWQVTDSPLPALFRPLPAERLRDAPQGPFQYCGRAALADLGPAPR